MSTIAKLMAELDMNNSGFLRGTNQAAQATSKLSSVFKMAAGVMGGFLGAQVIGRAIQGLGDLAGEGIHFGKEMANVNSIAQLSDKAIGDLGNSVIKLAGDSRISQGPAELAKGLYQLVSAGFNSADSLTILKQSAMAASAGLTDTNTATTTMVSVLDAYHLGADQAGVVSNQLFQIVNSGVLSFEQLASTIGTVLPTAAALGVGLNDLGAAYTVLTRQGVSADEATTQISGVMTGLLNPTTALTDALQAQGYASGAALVQTKGFSGAMEVLNGIIGGNADVATAMFGNVRALRGILGLTTNSGKDFTSALKEMGHAQDGAGATAKALSKQMKSAGYWINQVHKQAKIAAAVFVGVLSPAIAGGAKFIASHIADATDAVGRFITRFNNKRDLGFGVWEAGLSALHTSLDQVFGKGFGDIAINFVSNIGNIVDDIMQTVGALASGDFAKAFDLGVITVTATFDFISNVAGDLWQWVVDQVMGVDTTAIPAGMGGRSGPQGGFETTSRDISFGTVLVTAGLELGGMIKEWAGNLWGWVQSQLGIGGGGRFGGKFGGLGGGGHTITINDMIVDISNLALGTVDMSITGADVSKYIQDKINNLGTVSAELHQWKMILFGPSDVEGEGAAKSGTQSKLQGFADAWDSLNATMKWIAKLDPTPEVQAPTVGEMNDALQRWASGAATLTVPFTNWTLHLTKWSDINIDPYHGSIIEEIVKDAGDITATIDSWNLHLGLPNISIAGTMGALGKAIGLGSGGFLDSIISAIGVPDVNLSSWNLHLPTPSFPDLSDINVLDWIEQTIDTFTIDFDLSSWNMTVPTPSFPDLSVDDVVGWIKDAISGLGDISVPMPDWHFVVGGNFKTTGSGNPGSAKVADFFGGDSGLTVTATINADFSAAQTAFNAANFLGMAWDQATFTGDLLGDISNVQDQANFAWSIGNQWDASTFTTHFLADIGNVQDQANFAWSIGNQWASQVFSASFAIDVSGLYAASAAADAVAAHIAAVMPHSPAKEGPLKEPIRFDFIADNFAMNMSRMVASAHSGTGRVRSHLENVSVPGMRTAGSGRGGAAIVNNHVHVDGPVYGIDDFNARVATTISKAMVDAAQGHARGAG